MINVPEDLCCQTCHVAIGNGQLVNKEFEVGACPHCGSDVVWRQKNDRGFDADTIRALEQIEALIPYCVEGKGTILPEANLIDIAARLRGWVSLESGRTMTIHFGLKRYDIRRVE